MKKPFERIDMTKKPISTRWFLRPLTYMLSMPDVKKHGAVITKKGVEGLKPPYILLCNHNAFLDFKVATAAIWPSRANYIVAIDGFIGREWLLRNVGCICKRKFTSDVVLLRHMKRSLDAKNVLVVYPEARYSLCGTTAVLPESLGACCRMLGVPRLPRTPRKLPLLEPARQGSPPDRGRDDPTVYRGRGEKSLRGRDKRTSGGGVSV